MTYDYENPWDEYLSDEEKRDYENKYHRSVAAKLEKIVDEDEREEVYNELCRTNYKPSGQAENDSDFVLMKARESMRKRADATDPDVKALLGHIAKQDKTDIKTAERKYRKAMASNDNDLRLRGGSMSGAWDK